MHTEHRRERRSVVSPKPKGVLQVLAGEKCLDVTAVMDASPMGMRLQVDDRIGIGENILVRYMDKQVDMKLNGTVVWNSVSADPAAADADHSACIIGISLAGPSLLQAFL
ncbi:MAG: PilZ domain-containing protein [Gammaproteobacteria bacterium]|nr:PilZ domain-containing protein [Gammaproteobacteria bacterium]MBU1776105.1 PilZ domain-containing protein [Gammaproteobacteria bacterium]MBU1970075.1 PilZ domain-containing protein [Gammaproteobacteria bacterium]